MRETEERTLFCKNSRCGSVTLAGKQRTVLFPYTLVPLRYLAKNFIVGECSNEYPPQKITE